MKAITNAIDAGYVKACHDLSEGGLAVAAAEMAFSGDRGIDLWLNNVPRTDYVQTDAQILFSESNSRFLVEVPKTVQADFEEATKGVVVSLVGEVKKERSFSVYGLNGKKVIEADLNELMKAWKSTFRM